MQVNRETVGHKPHDTRCAIVTGGSSGVGEQYAMQLAERGYNIVLVSNLPDKNQTVATQIKTQYPVDVATLDADLTREESVAEVFALVDANAWRVEVLISNAGVLLFGGVASASASASTSTSASAEKMARTIDLHCKIPALLCHEAARRMCAAHSGYILLMASATVWMPYPTIATYSATKAFLHNFGRALAEEVRPCGVRLTVVYPGAIDTPFYTLDSRWRQRLRHWGILSSAQSVAHKGLHALFHGKRRCIPGAFTKLCVVLCALTPMWLLRPLFALPKVRRLWE
ncbi:MAG: SDR family NAD(P)-dependent oxidoreductase [Alistipes sp.]